MKVLFAAPISKNYIAKLPEEMKDYPFEFDFVDERKMTQNFDFTDYEIVIGFDAINHADFNTLSNLKAYINVSTGIDHLDERIFDINDFKISNNKGAYAAPISEWIVMSFLMGLKQVPKIIKQNANKEWKLQSDILECYGKNVLFLGAGDIAASASRKLKAFGTVNTAYRRSDKKHPDFDNIVNRDELLSSISKADAVVVCLPNTNSTKNFVNDDVFKAMRDDAIYINISRGDVADEDSLLKYIDAGKFRFIALDVFKEEPQPKNSPFWNVDRVFMSSHTSWVSEKMDERIYDYIVKNLKSFASEGDLVDKIDWKNRY